MNRSGLPFGEGRNILGKTLFSTVAVISLMVTVNSFAGDRRGDPVWLVDSLPYRLQVEVPSVDLGERTSDFRPASVSLDFGSARFTDLGNSGTVDLNSLRVFKVDPNSGEMQSVSRWPFARTPGEVASRFDDSSLSQADNAYLINVEGDKQSGSLVWNHRQESNKTSYYSIYFDFLPAGTKGSVPRKGFIGDGNPRRATESDFLTGWTYNSVEVSDWDGDGLPDLIIGIVNGHMLLFRNQGEKNKPSYGQGTYVRDADNKIIKASGSLTNPRIVDWNNDGALDIVLGIQRGQVSWFENTGTNRDRKLVSRGKIHVQGEDLSIPKIPCPEAEHYEHEDTPGIEVVDWDNDGDIDLLLGGFITGRIWLYENTGNADDGTPTLFFRGAIHADGKPLDTSWCAYPCAVDLDGDGDLDLLSGNLSQQLGGKLGPPLPGLLYYENTGSRSAPRLNLRELQYQGETGTTQYEEALSNARPFDFNGDGLLDLVVADMYKVRIFTNVGTSSEPRFSVDLLKSQWGVQKLDVYVVTQILDWDGDGDLDLLSSASDSTESPRLTINQGEGQYGLFAEPRNIMPAGKGNPHPERYGDPYNYLYYYDIEPDGELDIFWTEHDGFAFLHRNHGTQEKPNYDLAGERLVLTNGQPVKVGPAVVAPKDVGGFIQMQGARASISICDFDADGLYDMAMGDAYGDVYYFANVGSAAKPVFAGGIKLGKTAERAKIVAYDWDEDGRVDIVSTSWGMGKFWFKNRGSEAESLFAEKAPFELPRTIPAWNKGMVIADWNDDGDDDFVVQSLFPWFCWVDGSYRKHGYAKGKILKVQIREQVELK